MEQKLGRLLIVGVSLAALLVLAGGIWFLADYSAQFPQYNRFAAAPASYRSFSAVLADAADGQSRGLIQLGLMLLIATPVARVIFSLILFARARDYVYCAITALVLAVLLVSLLG